MPDLLRPDALAPLLKGTIFPDHIQHFPTVGSTNTAAMRAAAGGAPAGTVFLAEQQSEGRGRGANTWHSEPGTGIYCSVIFRPALPPSDVLVLTLATGLAVHSAIQQIDPHLSPDLKWPNDGLLDGKKFCGILTEMHAEATRVRYIVVGIGLNVNHTIFPPELQPIATSLRLVTGTEWSRVELCAALLKSLDREYHALIEGRNGHDSILRRFQERSSSIRGKHVYIEEHPELDGITAGLDQRGFLQIETARGLQPVLSGTVRLK